jgi:predicted small metal-binding protein
MAENTDKQITTRGSGLNPNLGSHPDGIDPTAPSRGTEGWGTTADERRAVSTHDAEATRAGQMKGNMGDNLTAASQQASEAATTNKRRSEDSSNHQADLSRRTSASAYSMNTSHGGNDHTFRCADVGNTDCRWETSAGTEDEVMQKAAEHNRNDHGMGDWTEAMRNRVRDSIRRREAA